jgi:aldose 1-epimerase
MGAPRRCHHPFRVMWPSGEQIEIALGDQRVTVVEVGGGLRAYEAAGAAVLDGYGPGEMCRSGRGQVLLPWPNRLKDASYEFDGRRHQLAINEVSTNSAIHGLVRWVAWDVREREPHRVVMEHILHPQPGYPFSLEIAVEYALSEQGLTVRTTATNSGADPCPYGSGMHPYLTLGARADTLLLHVPASTVGGDAVAGTEYDFRAPRPIGATVLDHCFTGLARDDDGRASVTLEDPASGARRTLWVDGAYDYLMVFTGDPLPDVARRAVAVEPMTCPPNALRTGEALIRLDPGAACASTWGITPLHGVRIIRSG